MNGIIPNQVEERIIDVPDQLKKVTQYRPRLERKNNRKKTRGRHTQVIVWAVYPSVFRKTIKHMR